MDPDELARSIRQARAGDSEARGRIFSLYLERIHAILSGRIDARLRSKLDTMEIVQSGIREALGDLETYEHRGPGSFYRWLLRIVERKLYGKADYWRAERRDVRRESRLREGESDTRSSPDAALPPAPDTPPALEVARRERDRIVREEIARLDEPYRTVVALHQDGLTDGEIAERVGKTEDGARWIRAQAMRKLSPRLKARLGTWLGR